MTGTPQLRTEWTHQVQVTIVIHFLVFRDFRLSQQSCWNLMSSGVWRRFDWLNSYRPSSGSGILLTLLDPEDKTDTRSFETSVNIYKSSSRNSPANINRFHILAAFPPPPQNKRSLKSLYPHNYANGIKKILNKHGWIRMWTGFMWLSMAGYC